MRQTLRDGFAFAVLSASIAASLVSPQAVAQSAYPNRPIRWIIPVAPGGGSDTLARMIQPGLMEVLGQQIVIDNRAGGSSVIGTEITAKSAPDGYTLLLVTTAHSINPSLIAKLPYHTIKDFAPVSLIASQSNILVVHLSVPAKSVKELISLAKAKPDTLSFGSGGNGTSPHLSGELFKLTTAIRMIHVPYKGTGPAVTDLLGGHVQIMFVGPLAVEQHVKSGRLRALAVASARRSSLLPDVPTMAEAGVSDFETGTWLGILAPARTPQPVIDRIHGAIVKTLQMPELKARLHAQGVDIIAKPPQQFADYLKSEVAKWAKVLRDAKLQAN